MDSFYQGLCSQGVRLSESLYFRLFYGEITGLTEEDLEHLRSRDLDQLLQWALNLPFFENSEKSYPGPVVFRNQSRLSKDSQEVEVVLHVVILSGTELQVEIRENGVETRRKATLREIAERLYRVLSLILKIADPKVFDAANGLYHTWVFLLEQAFTFQKQRQSRQALSLALSVLRQILDLPLPLLIQGFPQVETLLQNLGREYAALQVLPMRTAARVHDSEGSAAPLKGLRVLDLTRLYPGPMAGWLLAAMGAEVTKIEFEEMPDYMAHFPPFVGGVSAGYGAVNQFKTIRRLSIQKEQDRTQFWKLAAQTDLLLESFRPGVLESLAIHPRQAWQRGLKLSYISITGYGQTGPKRQKAGHDLNYLAESGLASQWQDSDGNPVLPNVQIADTAAGAYGGALGALAAVIGSRRHQQTYHVDVSISDLLLPLGFLQAAQRKAGDQSVHPNQHLLSGAVACYGIYTCGDGRHLALAALEPKFWTRFCEWAGKPQWKARHLDNDQSTLKAEITSFFLAEPMAYWVEKAKDMDICISPVCRQEEVERDPHFQARGMFTGLQTIAPFQSPLVFNGRRGSEI